MAQAVSFDIKNFKSFNKFLDKFPEAVTKPAVAARALKKAGKPMVKAIKARTRVKTGALKKSVGSTVSKRRSGPLGQNVVAIGPRRSKTLRGFTGTYIESGTAERKTYNRLKLFGNKKRRKTHSTGRVKARPFVGPGFNATVGVVLSSLSRILAIEVVKEAKKQAAKAGSNR